MIISFFLIWQILNIIRFFFVPINFNIYIFSINTNETENNKYWKYSILFLSLIKVIFLFWYHFCVKRIIINRSRWFHYIKNLPRERLPGSSSSFGLRWHSKVQRVTGSMLEPGINRERERDEAQNNNKHTISI